MAEDTLGPTEMAAHQPQAQVKLLKYALFVLAGVLLLAGVVGGYWIKSEKLKTQISKPQPKTQNLTPIQTPVVTAMPTPTPIPDPTADWKTYTSQEFNFEIKYPSDWYVYDPNTSGVGNVVAISDVNLEESNWPGYRVNITRYSWNGSVERYVQQHSTGELLSEETVVIDDTRGLRRISNDMGVSMQIYLPKSNYIYFIYATLKTEKHNKYTDQILSTFKFLDSTQDTSQNWETYQSEKIMDSLKTFRLYYPPSWKITVEKRTEQPQTLNVTLSKNGFLIGIGQFPGSVASCLYPEDPQLEGMYARYGEYKEILKKNGVVWRRAVPEGQPSKLIHGVCERRSSANGRIDFVGFTSIGSIYLESPILNNQILSEFDQILEKIEILD